MDKIKKGLFICLLLTNISYAADIKAIKTNENFEETARIDKLEQIKFNTPPTTQYTPKNLKKQQIIQFQGRNTETGAMTVWSSTFTDYDTKIIESELTDNGYFIKDNTGKTFKTGDNITPLQNAINNVVNDLGTVQTQVNTNTNQINQNKVNIQNNTNQINMNKQNIQQNRVDINQNRQDINTNAQNIQRMNNTLNQHSQDIQSLNNRMDNLERNVYSGLATVTALTSLHPNPRSTSPIELSIGAGVFRDQCAGAAGLFVHPTDNVMIQGGFAFGNENNYAGYTGITISLPWFKKR